MSSLNEGVSVIICCYNSAKRIQPTLEYLARQKNMPNDLWEIIIVDNNCTDNTVEIALHTWQNQDSQVYLQIVEEQIPGLSAARHKGLQTAKFEYILFCDDDNWLNESYVHNAFKMMQSNTQIGALCGYNEAVGEVELPYWFNTFQTTYAVGVPSIDSGDVSSKGWIWGAGMVLRKSLMNKLYDAGFRNLTTDRKGNELSTGGDVEICKWILLVGYKLWFDSSLSLKHFIPKERLTKDYLVRLQEQNGIVIPLYTVYDFIISEKTKDNSIIRSVFVMLKLRLKKMLGQVTFYENLLFESAAFRVGLQNHKSTYIKIKHSYSNFLLKKS